MVPAVDDCASAVSGANTMAAKSSRRVRHEVERVAADWDEESKAMVDWLGCGDGQRAKVSRRRGEQDKLQGHSRGTPMGLMRTKLRLCGVSCRAQADRSRPGD